MKKTYEQPKVEIIVLENEDIITMSTTGKMGFSFKGLIGDDDFLS